MQNWLLDSLYETSVKQIARGRNVDAAKVRKWIDSGPYSAEKASDAGLDRRRRAAAGFRSGRQAAVRRQRQLDTKYGKKSHRRSTSPRRSAFSTSGPSCWRRQKNADAQRRGRASSTSKGRSSWARTRPACSIAGAQVAASTPIRKALNEAAADDDSIKAVVLRVDSPGGSAVASEIILDATKRVKAKKPFIVSMGNVAGSGGYYVACGADTIFADEATITGSIGVVGGKLATTEHVEQGRHHLQGVQPRRERRAAQLVAAPFTPERAQDDAGLDGRDLRRLQGPRHGDPRQPAQEADRRPGRRPRLHRQAGPRARPGRQDRHARTTPIKFAAKQAKTDSTTSASSPSRRTSSRRCLKAPRAGERRG